MGPSINDVHIEREECGLTDTVCGLTDTVREIAFDFFSVVQHPMQGKKIYKCC